MCCDNLIKFLRNKMRHLVFSVTLLMVTMTFFTCETAGLKSGQLTIEHHDGIMNYYSLALHFAPRLYLHEDEPFEIIAIIPVFHPVKPIIAYHIFLEDDAVFAWGGKEIDHEIIWIEYDPITLKVSDVATYWHRTVLRTDICLMDAKASQQRPKVFMQWGQHGILPLGWEKLQTARPFVELLVHYNLVTEFSRIRTEKNIDSPVTFQGSYQEYLQFTRAVDAATYLKNQKIIVAEYPTEELKSQVKQTFPLKKEWPFWYPTD